MVQYYFEEVLEAIQLGDIIFNAHLTAADWAGIIYSSPVVPYSVGLGGAAPRYKVFAAEHMLAGEAFKTIYHILVTITQWPRVKTHTTGFWRVSKQIPQWNCSVMEVTI